MRLYAYWLPSFIALTTVLTGVSSASLKSLTANTVHGQSGGNVPPKITPRAGGLGAISAHIRYAKALRAPQPLDAQLTVYRYFAASHITRTRLHRANSPSNVARLRLAH